MTWIDYVTEIAGGETQSAIGYKIGVSGATISRWATFAPKPENVAAFARAYQRPVLEAFIAAGFLTEQEAGERPAGKARLSELTSDELLAEIGKRIRTHDNLRLAAHRGEPDVPKDRTKP